MSDPISQFKDAMLDAGLVAPGVIEPGKIHRYPGMDKSAGNTAAWCKLFDDGLGGVYGDYSTGLSATWQAKRETPFSQAERDQFKRQIAEAQKQRDADEKVRHAEAATKAAELWQAATPAPDDFPYLVRKGIEASGTRLHDGRLVIPMRDGGKIHSLQFIDAHGSKKFLPGGRVAGCYHSLGSMKDAVALCIAEGIATGASIHEATGLPVAVAFNAGNLEAVAKVMRAKFSELRLIICADDDAQTTGNPGLTKATAAALAVSGLLAVPDFGTDRPDGATDFNDMAQLCGKGAVQKAVARAKAPAMAEHQAGAENAPKSSYARTVDILRGSDIKPEAVNWLWYGWLAAGKLHVLGGAPGTGKTTISMALAATLTIGGRWPDGNRSTVGNVVIWSGEDDPSDTLIPRLLLSGADVSRVYFISDVREGNEQRSFDPARDMDVLKRKLAEIGDVRLLIVDPIVSAIAGDSHKNAEVRRGLQPLVDLAASMRCALIGITHFSKGTGGRDPVERLTGSLAFGAQARVVLVAAKHQEEGEDGRTVRLFCRAKSNIGPDDGGFEYDLHQGELKGYPGVFTSTVLWGEAVEGAARELLATADSTGDEVEGVDGVAEWLSDLVTEEGGSIDRRDVMKAGRAMGYTERTIHRARVKIGLVVDLHGFGKAKRSVWKKQDSSMCASTVPYVPNNLSGKHGTHGENDGTHRAGNLVEVEI